MLATGGATESTHAFRTVTYIPLNTFILKICNETMTETEICWRSCIQIRAEIFDLLRLEQQPHLVDRFVTSCIYRPSNISAALCYRMSPRERTWAIREFSQL